MWVCANCEAENEPALAECVVCGSYRSVTVPWETPPPTELKIEPIVVASATPRRPKISIRTIAAAAFAVVIVVFAIALQSRSSPAEQEEKQYRSARGNLDRLKSYIRDCRVCAFKSDGAVEVARLERDEATQREERAYRSANGNLIGLRAYVASCQICAFRPGAEAEIAKLERAERAQQEEKQYRSASGNLEQLKSYTRDCRVCAFESAARTEIRELERRARLFSFEICNPTTFAASAAIAGRKDPASSDWTVQGWWTIAAGSCVSVGTFAKRKIYAMAKVRGELEGWYGSDTKQCVEFPGPFQRIVSANTKCPASGKIIGFQAFDIETDTHTWRLSSNPELSEDEFFTFEVCNKSQKLASVAMMGRSRPSAPFVVQGWRNVAAGSCQVMGAFARGYFYATASVWGDINSGWWQEDTRLCVELPGPFSRINSGEYTCGYNEKLMPFTRFSVASPRQIWTLN